jgi:hypothetical protein
MRKAISRDGQPVELTLYEVVDMGSQGDMAEELTTVETNAVVDTGGTVDTQVERDLIFTGVDSDVFIYLRDDVLEGVRAENYDGDMVRPVILSTDTAIQNAATEVAFINEGPMNRGRTFVFEQAHEWSDAGIIAAGATLADT